MGLQKRTVGHLSPGGCEGQPDHRDGGRRGRQGGGRQHGPDGPEVREELQGDTFGFSFSQTIFIILSYVGRCPRAATPRPSGDPTLAGIFNVLHYT